MSVIPPLLGILDQSPIRNGGTAGEALAESVQLAQAAEQWGYQRYWVAEHHSSTSLAGAAPEILIARIAGATTRMRIGSGGVMLSHYSSLKVAETFRVLEALYPHRIDLGLGRAPGSDWRTAEALAGGNPPRGPEQYPRQLSDLIGFLDDRIPNDHPHAGIHASPSATSMPEIWLLGSSDQSALMAAYFGCAFSFAHFINDQDSAAVMTAYRTAFRPSPRLAAPRSSLGVFVLCAETEAEAERLAQSRDLSRLRFDQGIFAPVPSIEEAEKEAQFFTEAHRQRIAFNRRCTVIGSPAQVKARLLELAAAHQADELAIVTICYDFAARLKSYELLAREFGQIS